MKTIDAYFDFGSPNAYLAWRVLPGIAQRTGATIRYHPVLLGGIFKATGNQPPLMAFGHVSSKLDYTQREMHRFMERHNITEFTFNPHFPVNTLLMMRMAVAAQEDNQLDAFMSAGFHHMWEDPKNMGDRDTAIAALTASGLDGAQLAERASDMSIKKKLITLTEAAIERGLFGLPSHFVGEEHYFGKDTLWEVEEALSR